MQPDSDQKSICTSNSESQVGCRFHCRKKQGEGLNKNSKGDIIDSYQKIEQTRHAIIHFTNHKSIMVIKRYSNVFLLKNDYPPFKEHNLQIGWKLVCVKTNSFCHSSIMLSKTGQGITFLHPLLQNQLPLGCLSTPLSLRHPTWSASKWSIHQKNIKDAYHKKHSTNTCLTINLAQLKSCWSTHIDAHTGRN